MFVRHFSAFRAAATLGLLLIPLSVSAQIPPAMPTRVNLEGAIGAIRADKIRVVTPAGQNWMVHLSKKTSVMLTGKADPTVLRQGMFVKFQAQVTGPRKAVSPIERIQVFTPTSQDVPGAFPHQGFGPADDAQAAGTGKSTDPGEGSPTYDVVGRITGAQKGRVIVSFGTGSLEIELAQGAQVELALADISFARPGDQIVCNGLLVGPEAARTVRATSIQIVQGQNPLQKTTAGTTQTPDDQKTDHGDQKQELAQQLVDLLTPGKKSKPSNESFTIEGDPTEFQPSARYSIAVLQRRFGQAQKTDVQGTLTRRGREARSAWQMWTWGPVKVIVDRSRKTRFFAAGP
ncbi:MAG: hypothetical protein JW888_05035 [Pirellulales bacterium]|nr:hypothetical protein [Pirellulales bacterium]